MMDIPINICYFLPQALLPEEFMYPESYKKYVAGNEKEIGPWSFLISFEVEGPGGIPQGLRNRYPERNLVPFARRLDCDDVACFDASMKVNEPKVLIIHDYASPGWELHDRYENFKDWLTVAQSESYE